MKNQNKHTEVWLGVEHLENDPQFLQSIDKEFEDSPALSQESVLDTGASRRDFLKYLGFGLGAATIAASCDIPVKRAIPYVVKPDGIVPGVATYYASSFVNGGDYCPVLVKTREGRPIKVEGNVLSSITKGGTSARAQASVLSLYDTNRYTSPMKREGNKWKMVSWEDMDAAIAPALAAAANIRIVTGTILSPTAKKALAEFTAKYPGAKVVTYDAVSASALLEANEASFGRKVVPNYKFDKASVIVGMGADFLGTWISPVEYARQYAQNRKIDGKVKGASMSRHIQVESVMTLTGSNADNRILIKPSEMGAAIANLYNAIAAKSGDAAVTAPKVNNKAASQLNKLAEELWANRGKSLVVSGSNNIGEQLLVNAINAMLDSYGNTISFANASLQRQGTDSAIQGLVAEMSGGNVGAVVFWGANPAFDLPNSAAFTTALEKVKTKISFSGTPDETTALCDYIAPASHWLESWGDAEPKQGHFSLVQPTIAPLFNTRQAEETILRWATSPNLNLASEQPYYDFLKSNWQTSIFPRQRNYATFQAFWDSTLHDGVFEVAEADAAVTFSGDAAQAAAKINKPEEGLEVSFFETVNVGAGQYADNPWLQEMPDPVTRCVWGNYLAIPIEFDGDRRFDSVGPFKGLNSREFYKEADQVNLTVNNLEQKVTCVRQFGHMKEAVGMALGYGRSVSGKCGQHVGVNVYPWMGLDANGNTKYYAAVAAVSEKVGIDEYASVQYHHTMGVTGKLAGQEETVNVDEVALMTLGKGFQGALTDRTVIRHANFSNLEKFAEELHHERGHHEHLNEQSLYPYKEYQENTYGQGHHWGLHIDLNSCIGCGACQVACVAENNVPVVGKHEVYRHHEMTWLRIDRYFYGDYENPNVVYQPMMCQHCDNAPCENVCPVSATNHSSEGLNQMAYNRCIGTRYCANNCPYKVRRFNWLDYTTADLFPANEVIQTDSVPFYADNLTRMVLNPDVTVRVRGVMEKCSFCVQRIQEAKLTAKRENRGLQDGDVKSACQTSCPTGAITFGDTNDANSAISKKFKHELNYIVLEEVNTRPSVQYTSKVINRNEALS
ncbi:MAG: hypothetical protein RI973_173 [Bacteroidota bacterium]|jgi:molybdopterin-containing oxidoreductase family iron-sulfur binding subunit